METKKITYQNLMHLIALINQVDATKRTRLSFAVEKLGTKWQKQLDEYNVKRRDIDIDFCSTDKEGNLMYEEITIVDKDGNTKKDNSGACKYTKENRKKRDAKVEELTKREIDIPTHVLSKDEPSVAIFLKGRTFTELNLLAGTLVDMPEINLDGDYSEEWDNQSYSKNGEGKKEITKEN